MGVAVHFSNVVDVGEQLGRRPLPLEGLALVHVLRAREDNRVGQGCPGCVFPFDCTYDKRKIEAALNHIGRRLWLSTFYIAIKPVSGQHVVALPLQQLGPLCPPRGLPRAVQHREDPHHHLNALAALRLFEEYRQAEAQDVR